MPGSCYSNHPISCPMTRRQWWLSGAPGFLCSLLSRRYSQWSWYFLVQLGKHTGDVNHSPFTNEESKLEKSSVKGQQYMIVKVCKSTYFILFHHITQCTLYNYLYIHCFFSQQQHGNTISLGKVWPSGPPEQRPSWHVRGIWDDRGDVENHTRVNIAVCKFV